MTATEIDYPIARTDENVREVEKEAAEEYEVPFDDSTPSLSRKRKNSSFKRSSRLPKMMRRDLVEDSNGQGMGFKEKKKRKISFPPCGRERPKKGRTSLPSKPESNSKLHISSSDEGGNKSVKKLRGTSIRKDTDVLRDDENAELKSENPSFDVIMKPAYVQVYLSVPSQFARHVFNEKSGNVILQISEGKTWSVGYNVYNEHSRTRLTSGWPAFARENNLTTGVKCNFKLINYDKLILKVVIDRANTSCVKSEDITGIHRCIPKLQYQSSCKERGKQRLYKCKLSSKSVTILTSFEKANIISRARTAFQSANPYFEVVMQPTYVEKRLDIPFKFVKTHFKLKSCEIVLQREDGSTTTVECKINRDKRQAYFRCSNWNAFVRDNNLEIGDVCFFELLKGGELLLKVVIIKNGSTLGVRADLVEGNSVDTKIEYDTPSDIEQIAAMCNLDGKSSGKQALHKEKAGRQSLERSLCSQRPKVFEAANKFISLYPYFKASITSGNLQNGVTVPKEFMKQTNQGDKTELMFQLQFNEKRWPVKYVSYPQYNVRRLVIGWTGFTKDNFLQVGDICAFELIDSESLVLKVTIFSPDE